MNMLNCLTDVTMHCFATKSLTLASKNLTKIKLIHHKKMEFVRNGKFFLNRFNKKNENLKLAH